MSSVMVTELQEINKKLELLNKLLIGDISPDVSVEGRTRFKTATISMSSTIADSAAIKAATAAGVVNLQEANRVIISTSGNPNYISYRMVFADGSISDEIELAQITSLPGKFKQIQINIDTAQSGSSVFVRQFLLPPLLADTVEGALSASVGVLDSSGNRVDPKTDDPIAKLADVIDIGFTLAKKTTPIFKTLSANIISDAVNTRYMTLEQPNGTDYSVPASKVFYALKVPFYCVAAAGLHNIGYGDDGVAEGIAAPTTPVYLLGSTAVLGVIVNAAANTFYELKIFASVPAGKFPFISRAAVGGISSIVVIGIEVDV